MSGSETEIRTNIFFKHIVALAILSVNYKPQILAKDVAFPL